jgi:hypothetical protein
VPLRLTAQLHRCQRSTQTLNLGKQKVDTGRMPPTPAGTTDVLDELRRLSGEYTALIRELADLRGDGPLPDRAAEYTRRDKIANALARLAALQQARSRFMAMHDLPTRL